MMRPIILQVALFRDHAEDVEEHERSRLSMLYFMEALVAHDRLWLQAYPETPNIYESGVKYEYKDAIGAPAWQDIATTIGRGLGDCKDFACWRVAELRERHGVDCHPVIRWRKVGDTWRFHALVEFEDHSTEDPSLLLGMKAIEDSDSVTGDSLESGAKTKMPPLVKVVPSLTAKRMAKGVLQGLLSGDANLRQRAMASYRKLRACADDPECRKALAMIQQGAAVARKRLASDNEETLGGYGKPSESVGDTWGDVASWGTLALNPVDQVMVATGNARPPWISQADWASMHRKVGPNTSPGWILSQYQRRPTNTYATVNPLAAPVIPSAISNFQMPNIPPVSQMIPSQPYQMAQPSSVDSDMAEAGDYEGVQGEDDSVDEFLGDLGLKPRPDTHWGVRRRYDLMGAVDPAVAPIATGVVSFIPYVGPLLAPLTPIAISEADKLVTKAQGGDPNAKAQVAAIKNQANQGDPDAMASLDAIQRVHTAKKMLNDYRKPVSWHPKSLYDMGIEGRYEQVH